MRVINNRPHTILLKVSLCLPSHEWYPSLDPQGLKWCWPTLCSYNSLCLCVYGNIWPFFQKLICQIRLLLREKTWLTVSIFNSSRRFCQVLYNLQQTDIYSMHLQKSQHQQLGFLCWFNYKCLYWQWALGFTVDRARHCMYFNDSFLISPAFQTWISCIFFFCKITFYLGLNWLHHHNINK